MANEVATIVAVCVLVFYVVLTSTLSVCWWIQRRKQRQLYASLEAQAEPSSQRAAYQPIVDHQQVPSRTASMYAETRSVPSMLLEGPGREPHGSDRNSIISYTDGRYSSVSSLLVPLQPVHSVEEEVVDDRLSVKTGRSIASPTGTIRYYALASQDEQLPAVPPEVPVPS